MNDRGAEGTGHVRRRAVTLEDVALRAGVSLKTASNAVNGTGRMGEATRERVLAVVHDLGYKVNVAARNLTMGTTGAISLAAQTLRSAYLAELAEAVIAAARVRDRTVYVSTYEDDGTQGLHQFLRQYNQSHTDGLLLSLTEYEHLEPVDFDVDHPMVCFGVRNTFGLVDRVATDHRRDAQTATDFLIGHGSRRIAVVGAHQVFDPIAIAGATEGNADLRLRGILERCAAAGLQLDPRLVGVTGLDWTIGQGFRAARDIIESGVPFDGMVCLNDGLAIGAISALRESGIRIPDDVQVIGFDNNEESEYLTPSLTTMDSRLEWIAETAVDRLMTRIAAPGTLEPAELLARSHLVARGTTR